MTGSENYSKIFLIHKDQWTSIPGMPVSNSATFDSPVNNKIGLGISLHNDTKGFNSRTGAYGYYSYKLIISDSCKLMFGLSLGIVDDRMNFSKAIVQNQNDPYLLNTPQRNTLLDSKAGIMFVLRKLELGFSALQLTGNSLQNTNNIGLNNMSRHLYVSSKYTFIINEEKNITFYPFVLVRMVSGSPFQYDINAVINWKNKAWLGATYRNNYAIAMSGGIKLFKNLSLGYAYDFITNSLNSYGGLSHEIIIGYAFADRKTRKHNKEIHAISKNLRRRGDSIIKQLNKCFEKKEHTSNKEDIQKIDEEIDKFKLELEKMKELINKKQSEQQ